MAGNFDSRRLSRCCLPGVVWLAAVLLPGNARAASCHGEGQEQPISTDRPTVTNSSSVVPCHALQIESGLTISSEEEQRGYDLPEAVLRFGVTKSSELRLNLPNYFQNFGSNGSFVTGLGDLGIGVKQALAATSKGFNLAVIGALSFPTGAYAVSSHGYDPAVQIMPSQQLPAHFSIAGMFSVAWPTQGSARNATGQASAVLDWQVKKPADVFAEYSGSFPSGGPPQHSIDFGALYRPTKRQQFDVRTGFCLSSAATDRVFGIGYSVRFDL